MFENVNGAVAEQNATTRGMTENVASTSHFIVSVGDSAAEIDSAAKEAEAHGERVASAGKAVTTFAQKLKTALRGAAPPGRARGTPQERTAALQSQNRNPVPAAAPSRPRSTRLPWKAS